jgi:hypothetical protein
MRYMMIWKPADTRNLEQGTPPSQEMMIGMGKFIEELAKSGVLLMTDGLQSSAKGARVRLSGGKFTVTDGPFTETKELIGGFAIVRLNSKSEAIELTKRFLYVAGEGESEIRLMPDEPAYAR